MTQIYYFATGYSIFHRFVPTTDDCCRLLVYTVNTAWKKVGLQSAFPASLRSRWATGTHQTLLWEQLFARSWVKTVDYV